MYPIDPRLIDKSLDQFRFVEIAKDQPEYLPLPARVDNGKVITCWKFTFKERLKILFTGSLFLSLFTFGNPLQPIRFDLDNPDY